MPLHAIITGDLISSRKIEPLKRGKLYDDINKFLKSLKKTWIKSYETYRGDSIQCEANSPGNALRVALIIKSFVMAYTGDTDENIVSERQGKGYSNTEFDIRLAIGVGEVDFIKKKKISSSDGRAFQLSGQALDGLKDDIQTLVFKTENETLDKELEPIIVLIDALIQKWTQNQAAFALNKLQNKKDEEIAALFNISIPAVNQRKKTAQWYAIEKAVQYFESRLIQ